MRWLDRVHSLAPFGRLQVYLVDRYDVFISKLFSIREKDRDDVRVLKPDTSGLVNRFTIRRRRGGVVAVQRSFFVRPSVQHSGSCADA